MNVRIRIFTLILLLLSFSGFADYYQAPLQEAKWEFKQSKSTCYLKQVIPLYGSADFVHRSGEPLHFSIQEQRLKPLIIKATLKAMPAPWMQHDAASSLDHQVYFDQPVSTKDYGRLSVYGDGAEAMIDALLQGQYPTFTYIRDTSSLNLEETHVAVSSINFNDSYKEFLSCRNNLRPVGI
jgi:hypothetical protein